jgi:hypothetical protein
MKKTIIIISYSCLTISSLTLLISFFSAGYLIGAVVVFIASLFWGISIGYKWKISNDISMLIFLLGISLAALLGAQRLFLLISILAALSAWDLGAFYSRVSTQENLQDEDNLIRTHLLRLISVIFIGSALVLLSFGFQLNLKFWQVFLLGILLLVGLSQVFIQIKRNNN